jgi:hypothetical protein
MIMYYSSSFSLTPSCGEESEQKRRRKEESISTFLKMRREEDECAFVSVTPLSPLTAQHKYHAIM